MITEKQYLEYLIKQYQNLIYSICLKSVGNPFDAEDLTQEVFLSAYKNLSRFDGNYEKAWLSKIAVRKCLDYLKAAGRRSIPTEDTYFSQIPDRQSSPEDEYMKTASNTHVEALCSSTASFPFVTKILCTNTSTTSPSRTGSSSRLLLALSVVFPTRTFSSRLLPRNATRSTMPSVAELLYFCSSFFFVTFTNSGRTMAFSPPGTSSK